MDFIDETVRIGTTLAAILGGLMALLTGDVIAGSVAATLTWPLWYVIASLR